MVQQPIETNYMHTCSPYNVNLLCILELFGQKNHTGVLFVHRKNSASLQNTSNDDVIVGLRFTLSMHVMLAMFYCYDKVICKHEYCTFDTTN